VSSSRVTLLLRAAILTLLVAVAAAAEPARATYRVGVGDQNPAMFRSPAWQTLQLERVRYLVPWDWARTGQATEVDAFMTAARAHGQDVLVTFTARYGCYDGRRYSRSKACRAPSARAYRTAFRKFDDRYPWVRTYSAWNEVNHISQPTFTRPGLAVRYYRVLRRESRRRRFRVMAADVLDTTNITDTCARSCAVRPVDRAYGDCTTTRTSTTSPHSTPAGCSRRCRARSG
jgi:hypothetical protein